MKTVFITCFHSFISKNILNTDVLKRFREKNDLRTVIFVPEKKVAFFEKHYAEKDVIIEGVDTARIAESRVNTFFSRLFFLMIDSHYVRYKREERMRARSGMAGRIKYHLHTGLVYILSRTRFLRHLVRFLFLRLAPVDFLGGYFSRYRPALVFSTDVFDAVDAQFLKEAKGNGVPTLGMVRSWDNCYSKGLLGVLPDRLLVNNEILKEEAVTIHGVSRRSIAIVGLPQFDAFVNEKRTPRREFFENLGISPRERLILFAPAGSILSDTDWQICEIVERARKTGEIGHPVHFFVRNHPGHPADLSRFKENVHFTIQDPGHVFDASNRKTTELEPADQKFLADLLFHSDIVMYVATSLSLDATVYDKPQIMIDFDGYEKTDYAKSVRRYHDEDHMKKLVATGGVRVVRDKEELVASINAYLDNPRLDSEGRQRIVREQLYRIDGKSGERVAKEILGFLRKFFRPEGV